MEEKIIKTSKKREFEGTVVSNKMTNTVRVRVEEVYRHSVYDKVLRGSKVYFAHTKEPLNIGDKVIIRESRPFSKNVKWAVVDKK